MAASEINFHGAQESAPETLIPVYHPSMFGRPSHRTCLQCGTAVPVRAFRFCRDRCPVCKASGITGTSGVMKGSVRLLRRPWFATLMLFPVVYALSHAPLYRLLLPPIYSSRTAFSVPGFGPVEWLIDNTMLSEPLLAWSALFGIRTELELDSDFRAFIDSVQIE